MAVTIKKIKKSKKVEETLQGNEERFHKIFDHSNDAIFVIDPARDAILDVNPKACSMLGYSREELLSLHISNIHPNEMPKLLDFAKSVAEHGRGWTNELTCLTKSGQVLPAEISASTIDVAGSTCMIALVRDITERKQMEEALRKAHDGLELKVEERTAELSKANAVLKEEIAGRKEAQEALKKLKLQNELILNSAGEGIYGLDSEGRTTFVNPAAAKMIGWESEELVGKPQHDILHHSKPDGTSYPREECPIYAAFKDGNIHHVDNEVFWRKDGTSFPVEYMSTPIWEDGKLVGAVVVFKDITERKRADEALRKALLEVEQLKNHLQAENVYLQEEIKTEYNFEEMIGQNASLQKVLRKVEQVAPTDATVLIQGETGTGKELLARAIHNLSPRKDRALVKVNCGAISAGLVESELFGHEKGAFTGAVHQRIGRFELADGGTIFLDEVGELPQDTQVKLLQVLQEGEFERVGGSRTIKVDVRVIAATNRDLKKALQEGKFRPDLFYRLNVFPISIPTLRERKEDIPLLARYFAVKYGTKLDKKIETIPKKTMDILLSYSWPGNIRELENVVERAVILTQSNVINVDESILGLESATQTTGSKALEDIERKHILSVLEETDWIIDGKRGAASILGMNPSTLRSRMQKLGIRKKG